MSLLVEQVPADERRFHELQQAALRVRAGMAGRFRTLGADLFEWREPAADAPLHVQIQALPLAKACFQSPAISVGTWIGGELGATERFIESCRHLITLKMMRLHEKGPFHQDPGSDELTALKQAAESRDRREFARLARTINWVHYPPTELVQAIDVALALDMIQVARELARKGQNLFPRNERIQRAAGVLSPPFFMRTRPSQTGAFGISQQWLKDHTSQYRGRWVAVRAGTPLGSAPTLKELYQQIGAEGRAPNTVIVKVL